MNKSIDELFVNANRDSNESDVEKKIANFLNYNLIQYQYDQPVVAEADRKKRSVLYPTFYLPEFNTRIGYCENDHYSNPKNNAQIEQPAYTKSGIDIIIVSQWMLKENWQGYIMQELKTLTLRRYQKLMTKPYWKKIRPPTTNYRTRNQYRGNQKTY